MADRYKTVKNIISDEIMEKKSRFIAYISPAKDEEEAKAFLESIRKKHYDARHNCFAWILGEDGEQVRYGDDGEPQGTAGRPMLDVLKGAGLTYTIAVVTRYFGGVLLGTGGLSRAYSQAVSNALSGAEASGHIITVQKGMEILVTADYTLTGKLMHIFENRGAIIADTIYDSNVTYRIIVDPQMADPIIKELTESTGGSAAMEKSGFKWMNA